MNILAFGWMAYFFLIPLRRSIPHIYIGIRVQNSVATKYPNWLFVVEYIFFCSWHFTQDSMDFFLSEGCCGFGGRRWCVHLLFAYTQNVVLLVCSRKEFPCSA